jgi:hypothetical protein
MSHPSTPAPRTAVALAFALSVTGGGLDAQVETKPTSVDDSANIGTELEEIIIRGQQGPRWGDLRTEIERAQEALFARFNEINSTDDFDIVCRGYRGSSYGKACLSNSARDFQNRIGPADFRGDFGLVQLLIHQAALRERELNDELRRLTTSDEQLQQVVAGLGQAQLAYDLSVGTKTLSRQVSATLGELPYDAEELFEVIMGNDPWRHRLTQRTFTIADVFGEVRRLWLECAEGNERIDYEIGVDWTVPSDRSACVLQVNAKKSTTFRLYEF